MVKNLEQTKKNPRRGNFSSQRTRFGIYLGFTWDLLGIREIYEIYGIYLGFMRYTGFIGLLMGFIGFAGLFFVLTGTIFAIFRIFAKNFIPYHNSHVDVFFVF